MTFLLGSDYCIESLSNDVNDIQSCVKDVMLKIGRINSISWKFPDKFACDLNIEEYLTNYKYDLNDIENNQISHIVLLELVIDRMCLLLQLHCETIERILLKASANPPRKDSSNTKTFSPCLGLTSKKHWNKLCQLSIYVDNIHKEVLQSKKMNKDLISELEKLKISKEERIVSSDINSQENAAKQASDWLKTLESENKNHLKNRKSITGSISKDVTFKSSQTIDTAFKPCESCHISQTCLRESSSLLMKLLKEESQSSSLMKLQQEILTIDWLSDKKILQIKDSFTKDLDKIYKYFRNIKQNETKTNRDLVESQKLCSQVKETLEKQKIEMLNEERKFTQEKQDFETKIKNYVSELQQYQSQINSMTEEFNSKIVLLEQNSSNLSKKLLEKEKIILQFDEVKHSINNFDVKVGDPLKALSLIKEKISQQDETILQLNSTIQNQQSINENMAATESIIKEKEDKLMKRLQNITQQKHKLEEKIDVLQDQLDSNQERLRFVEKENRALAVKLSEQSTCIESFSKTKDEFNSRIKELEEQNNIMEKSIVELKEQNKLLLNFPDLNGRVEKIETGNIEQDIQNQIKANYERIKLLTEQNHDFANAIEKLTEKAITGNENKNHNGIVTETLPKMENFPQKIDIPSDSSRPNSKMSFASQSTAKRISHRQSALQRPRSRDNINTPNTIIQWSVSNNKTTSANLPCVCETCGRQYQQKSDLEVHKEYCAGRRRRVDNK